MKKAERAEARKRAIEKEMKNAISAAKRAEAKLQKAFPGHGGFYYSEFRLLEGKLESLNYSLQEGLKYCY